ncbi:hypothetical protein Cni_G08124 [Canna indica]|uniref:PSII 6.1 kDa protein n=1 Tax=Canna indica TaxID=4628 RepID=A0AAQ3Q834_9LILI|nr:hypothetical protein Cni_G08124 [Canna indica]
MATISAAAASSTFVRPAALPRQPAAGVSSAVLGLPRMAGRGGRARCSAAKPASGAASLLAAASVMTVSNPVLALVDERMSTEGTGLSLGISNNLLVWILLGVFGLIWALFFIYTSTLEEDEDSALSL